MIICKRTNITDITAKVNVLVVHTTKIAMKRIFVVNLILDITVTVVAIISQRITGVQIAKNVLIVAHVSHVNTVETAWNTPVRTAIGANTVVSVIIATNVIVKLTQIIGVQIVADVGIVAFVKTLKTKNLKTKNDIKIPII